MKPPYRILIVDDHRIVLKGLSQLVTETLGPGTVSDTASTEAEALDLVSRNTYSLCILDIELPGSADFRLLHIFRDEYPEMKIIVNTVHEQVWYVRECIAAGVEGILFKNIDTREISQAITTVLSGSTYMCRAARSLRLDIDNHSYPTLRELDVLKALAEGCTTAEISQRLGISANTTESHRRHLLEKFEAKNVAELIVKAARSGIIQLH